jgi:hypothetical protein
MLACLGTSRSTGPSLVGSSTLNSSIFQRIIIARTCAWRFHNDLRLASRTFSSQRVVRKTAVCRYVCTIARKLISKAHVLDHAWFRQHLQRRCIDVSDRNVASDSICKQLSPRTNHPGYVCGGGFSSRLRNNFAHECSPRMSTRSLVCQMRK